MEIQIGEVWLDRDGVEVHITHVDETGPFPVHGYIMVNGEKQKEQYTSEGRYLGVKAESQMDLVEKRGD